MSPFLDQLIPNLVGSAFGVGLALVFDRWGEARRLRRQRQQEREDRDEREASQLRIVQWLSEENLELAQQAVRVLDAGGLFFFPMNTHLLDAGLTTLSTLCEDQELLWTAEHFRYQLHHLNAKIRVLADAGSFQGTPTGPARKFLHEQIVPSIRTHLLEQVVPKAGELKTRIGSRIQILSKVQRPPVRPSLPSPLTVEMPSDRQ